jgi:ABC-type Zn uptake system ZnuABC Zn-binding protein ZnuA
MQGVRCRFFLAVLLLVLVAACGKPSNPGGTPGLPRVLVVESFLADITRNVSGDRLTVEALMPLGADPHAFQPTPQDAARVADADVLVVNGANLESFLAPLLQNAGSANQLVIDASAGLTPRPDTSGDHPEGDPHFWLDPTLVIKYVENIRDGLSQADPDGANIYKVNADNYIAKLQDLDGWISSLIQQEVPPSRRMLVTNHETFGYFAARYGFTVVGAILPSISSGASPSAQELAALVDKIRTTGVPAIFLETGSNTQLADQIAAETGVKVISGLYTHSLSPANGPCATYLDMMKYDVNTIVDALK